MCLTWPDCPKVPSLTDSDLDCHNKEAEITMLTLEKSSYAQLLDDAKHEIARLNSVIRAMATELGTYPCKPDKYWDGKECLGRKCAQCIIDHFTKQEAKDDSW